MILDELIYKLGFAVEGLQKLRAARKEWDKTVRSTAKGNKAIIATNRSTAVATTGVSRLGTALRTILGAFARLITVAAGVAAGIAVVGTAFVVAGVRAARARREFALTAKEIGTTGQNLETLGNILRVAGFGDGFEKEAERVAKAVDEISKSIRKGGEDADEAKKKFQGFGIDKSFDIDPKTGKSRDSAAIALDIFQAYKRATEQAANLRKEADAIASKSPRKAAALRKKAIAQDQKTEQFAEDAGIGGRLRVLLDSIALKDLPELVKKAARLFPTTSNASEAQKDDVAKQAEDAALKASALLKGTADRLTDIGVALATHVLPHLNAFLDKLITFGKATGLISETVGEKNARESKERLDAMAAARRAERQTYDSTPQDVRNKTQADAFRKGLEADEKRYGKPTTAPLPPTRPAETESWRDSIRHGRQSQNIEDRRPNGQAAAPEGWLQYFRRMLSPETNASKLQKTAETSTDSRTYTDIGNDKRTQNVTVNQTLQQDAAAVAAAARNAVLGAISTKGANTSTGALTAP